jgi:hypothetical protein
MPIQLSGSLVITGSITTTGGITISGSILSASYSDTASFSNNFRVLGNLTASTALVTGTLTAQTLVVQTVTSSIVYSSGSNIFGSQLTDRQTFTGSVNITGSSHSIFGNLGIGTTGSTDPLLIQTNANAQKNVIFQNVNTTDTITRQGLYLNAGNRTLSLLSIHNGDNYIQGSNGASLYFQQTAGGTINMTISSSGYIGIGETNPTEILQANGSIRALQTTNDGICQVITDASNSTTYRAALATFGNTAAGNLLGISRASNSFLYKNGATLVIGTGAAFPLIFSTNDTERMRISGSGNIGIGVTSPNGLLSLKASLSDIPVLRFQNNITSGLDAALSTYVSSTQTYLTVGTNCYINSTGNIVRFNTSNESSFIGFDAGNIVFGNGISSANPGGKMTITSGGYISVNYGAIYTEQGCINTIVSAASNFLFSGQNTNSSNPRGLYMDMANTTGGDYTIYCKANGYPRFYVNGAGSIYSTSTSITLISSDINLKTDIKDYDKGLAEVLLMKPRYYKYKDNLEEEKIGFIAQEMEQALTGSMIDVRSSLDSEETHKSYQIEWYPLLVKAIQELSAKVTALETK